jgi:hypothetical protein
MKSKIIFAVMAVMLIATVSISSAVPPKASDVGANAGTCSVCMVCNLAKRALSAVKAKDFDRAMDILENAMEIEVESLALTELLESAYSALKEEPPDVKKAGDSLKRAVMLCESLK